MFFLVPKKSLENCSSLQSRDVDAIVVTWAVGNPSDCAWVWKKTMKRDEKVTGMISLIYIQTSLIYIQMSLIYIQMSLIYIQMSFRFILD